MDVAPEKEVLSLGKKQESTKAGKEGKQYQGISERRDTMCNFVISFLLALVISLTACSRIRTKPQRVILFRCHRQG